MNILTKNTIHTHDKSALIIVLFVFQFGLLLPFTILLGGQYISILFTLALVVWAHFSKKLRINARTIFLIIIPIVLLILKLPYEYAIPDGDIAVEYLISFSTIGLSGILFGALQFSYDSFFHYAYKIGWINFLIIFSVPFLSSYGDEVNYMRFGYAMLPTVMLSAYFLFQGRYGYGAILLFAFSFIEMFLFGARGATLTLIAFATLYVLTISRTKVKILFLAFIVPVVLMLPSILTYVESILIKYNLFSYSLTKYINVFSGIDFAATTSGRDVIYETAQSRIFESPIVGSPINSCLMDTGSPYYHNIFLDILVNFGFVIFIFFILFILYFTVKAFKSPNRLYTSVFFILLLIPMGRLLVSSTFWQRADFWLFISFCINTTSKGIKKDIKLEHIENEKSLAG